MTKLLWDATGSRRFEGGCDRGVLYLPDGTAVPWNGLTSVTDDTSDVNVEEYYLDGLKYLNRRVAEDYSGTLKALTYPDEFMPFDGVVEWNDGLYATGQSVGNTFGLSYRTLLGTDTSALGVAYRIHLLYNLTAKPDPRTYSTLSTSIAAPEMSWMLSGIPVQVPGQKPSVHIFVDSNQVLPGTLASFETLLYGDATTDGTLPDPATLAAVYPTP